MVLKMCSIPENIYTIIRIHQLKSVLRISCMTLEEEGFFIEGINSNLNESGTYNTP